ncbi:peptidase S41 [Elizabethkingia anophelis]|nr:peptidase S41 [Elizabethkingia anophelis]QNV08095.1 peptidase S41 [Elizabethkingia anophelis]UTF89834.1 peptidase S41 [Elizabethkingia anophelis]UTG00705.1 peptidase S41 [Elizabethkingia anophelis]UTG04455.1 peptidase S41 [Elizabethkingia anophelis]
MFNTLNYFNMKRNLKQYIIFGLMFIMASGIFNSCVKDDEISITEPVRYTSDDIKSYADLFKVFWTVMDQRYNYFYEQKRKDNKDWNAVYREYYPKFSALKTWAMTNDMSDKDILDDRNKAIEYFKDIIDPIIDGHFVFSVLLPLSKSEGNTQENFRGGMKNKPANIYNFNSKLGYMFNRVDNRVAQRYGSFIYMMGNLRTNPEIYYISYNQFAVYNTSLEFQEKYLMPNPIDNYVLTANEIEKNPDLNAIKDANTKNRVKDFTLNVLSQWNAFFTSADVKSYNEQVAAFKNTEIVSDAFIALTRKLLNTSGSLVAYNNKTVYSSVLNSESDKYITWFMKRMGDHTEKGYNYTVFKDDADDLIFKSSFYQKFLNPLRKGDIKKLIIDLRGNGGGAVIDFRLFVERFVTKNSVWGYQRTKEGNGQFNYTPWVPMQAKPHKFNMPTNIPIAILTDKGSYSMSEMSTMMLKSQGSHVVSIGDFTGGATAGLTPNPDEFNGGSQETIAGTMRFYMPVMATKDMNGNVIEGIGVKPDIFVTPPTDAEVAEMKNSPATFVDRVMNEAVKYLSGK